MKPVRIIQYAAPALLLGLLFFSCTKKEDLPPPPAAPVQSAGADARIVATVDGDPVTLAEFQERFSRAGFKPEPDAEREVKQDFLNGLVERKMMLREAQRKRIRVSVQEIDQRIATMGAENGKELKETLESLGIDFEKWKSDVWEDMMIERLIAREMRGSIAVSPSEVRRYYEDNPAEFDKPEQVRVRQIVVTAEQDAQRVLDLLKAGTDFAAVARKRSTAPEADNGGDLGYFGKGDMPAEFNVVFEMQKGDYSGIVKSPYGFHIFKLEERRKAGRIGIDQVYKDIEGRLRKEKEDARYQRWLKGLQSRTQFAVNYPALMD